MELMMALCTAVGTAAQVIAVAVSALYLLNILFLSTWYGMCCLSSSLGAAFNAQAIREAFSFLFGGMKVGLRLIRTKYGSHVQCLPEA